jgi:pyruvate ferredoxin oxidoreductase beta subunit
MTPEQFENVTPVPFKKLAERPDLLTGGHRLCAGCAESMIVRQVLMAAQLPVVVVLGTGCLEVATTIYPSTAWEVPTFHCAFENASAAASGVAAAYVALKERNRIAIPQLRVLVFAGDGGTYDIGLQSLSGALERRTRFTYVCLNNEGYMNTGIQRSGATPFGAETTTTPPGDHVVGKVEWRKDLTDIVVAHDIPYFAQTAPSGYRPHDLKTKAAKAFAADGPSFINVLSPCTRGWRYMPEQTVAISELAIETCYWPLFEVINGKWRLNYKPRNKRPIQEWLAAQGRFHHLVENQTLVEKIQERIDREWDALLARCGEAHAPA